MEPHMNIYAILTASLVPMTVGFLYYHPSLLGAAWMRANGFSKETLKAPNPMLYALTLVTSLMMSLFLWTWVTGAGGADGGFQTIDPKDGHSFVTFQHGLVHGALISILFILPVFVTMSIFEKRGWNWAFVNWGYWAITCLLMCGILSAWR
jgi:hypothetical protein